MPNVNFQNQKWKEDQNTDDKCKCWFLALTMRADLYKHLQKDSIVKISWRITSCSCLFWPWESCGMPRVGCGGMAAGSSVAAVNSFPNLDSSSSRAGPRQGRLSSSRMQVLPSNALSCALRPDGRQMFRCGSPSVWHVSSLLVLPIGSR